MANSYTQIGRRQGHGKLQVAFPVGASEVFKKKGGGFVKMDGSGRIEIAGAGHTGVIGAALIFEDYTAPSTEGAIDLPVDTSWDSLWEIPINSGTYAATMRGKTCDLSVASGIQGAALDLSSDDVVLVVDKGSVNAAGTAIAVLVQRYPKNQVLSGVV